jgi:predicted HicB family RNase H-like nuclease
MKKKPATNGNGIKPVAHDGVRLNLRMRSPQSIGQVKKAAKKAGLSMNTWAAEVLERAAQAQVTQA